MPSMDLYRIFFQVVKEKSISNAARKLYITQPAVSQAIKQLEKGLNSTLLIRTPRGIQLTANGEKLLEYIEPALNFIDIAENEFKDMENMNSGEVKIGASDTLCKYYLLKYLGRYHNEYPDIKISVSNGTTFESIELIRKGKVDFGIVNLPLNKVKGIETIETISIQDCFVISPDIELEHNPITLKELSSYPLMLLEKGTNTRDYVDRFFKENGIDITAEIELGSIDLLVEFAKIGLGVSCVIKNYVKNLLEEKKLVELKTDIVIPERKVGIAMLRGAPLSVAADKFIKILLER